MSTDTLITLGASVAGLITFAVVMGRWEKATIAAMGAADHFQVKGFEATIDRARNEVHICVEGHARIFRAPFGHLVVEHKVETTAVAHEKRPTRRRGIALTSNRRRLLRSGSYVAPSSGWTETTWTAVETGKTWLRLRAVRLPAYYAQHWGDGREGQTSVLTDAMDVPLSNSKARALKLWLDHHRCELFPDHAALRATWEQTCAELLRACRQQRDHQGIAAGAFESWSFSAHPTIAYLVIEADGAAFWASGDTPMLEPVERPRFKLAGDRLTVFSADDNRSFPLPADRMAPLQALQRRGIVRLG
ncbi:MAG TPA: hypothetical protein VK519_07220 [Pinirhizobacter sp.]|uniref:hypothetical protein n=1 Tax=Pinirhizobacter sp. TaxID=2950432 RepID=UPI002C2CDC9F|nr:hypothetical protein [Pinirhizobacter sp.]HMH67692.1 hypothetical protein [Pinirhizobacter sp.]